MHTTSFSRKSGRYVALTTIFGTLIAACALPASAQIIYQNDFETNTNGFNFNTTVSRTTGNTGILNAPLSKYLGRFTNDSVVLSLTGLTAGTAYTVSFDLFIEATMDGVEPWTLTSSSNPATPLVNTTFANFGTQAYSDTTFTATSPQDKATFTGADVVGPTNVTNTDRYSIYYFGHGAGNPTLSFVAAGTTGTLTFAGANMQDVTDESWSLDNVIVRGPGATAAPEPGTLILFAVTALPLAGLVLRRRSRRA